MKTYYPFHPNTIDSYTVDRRPFEDVKSFILKSITKKTKKKSSKYQQTTDDLAFLSITRSQNKV